MTNEAEQWRFRAAILDFSNHGKAALLIKLLRADYPITIEDKQMLADYFEGKLTPKRTRADGRPVEKLYSPTWYLQQAVAEVRDIQKRYGLKRGAAIDWVCFGAKLQGKDLDKRRDEILQALNRGKKSRTK